MSYVLISFFGADGAVVATVRCQAQHADDHPTPAWAARRVVSQIAGSAPVVVPVVHAHSPSVKPYPTEVARRAAGKSA